MAERVAPSLRRARASSTRKFRASAQSVAPRRCQADPARWQGGIYRSGAPATEPVVSRMRIVLDPMDITGRRVPRVSADPDHRRAAPVGMRRSPGKFMIEKLARVRWKSITQASSGTAIRSSRPTRSPWSSPNPGRPPIPWLRSGKREAKQRGSQSLAICNVIGCRQPSKPHAGPKIGVASTKPSPAS